MGLSVVLLSPVYRQALDRNEFEAVFGAGAAAVPVDELADPVALAAARSHIEAAIRMGREVIPQLSAQQLQVEVNELTHMIEMLEHPLQGELTQLELEQVIIDAQNLVAKLLVSPSPRV